MHRTAPHGLLPSHSARLACGILHAFSEQNIEMVSTEHGSIPYSHSDLLYLYCAVSELDMDLAAADVSWIRPARDTETLPGKGIKAWVASSTAATTASSPGAHDPGKGFERAAYLPKLHCLFHDQDSFCGILCDQWYLLCCAFASKVVYEERHA